MAGQGSAGQGAAGQGAAGWAVRLRPDWVHAPRLTGRRMMVAAMALFLVVVLASPFQTYLSRRASVAGSERQQQQLNAQLAELQHQSEQWQDPAFVARQARIRLQYIRPGDTLYTVLDAHGDPLGPPTQAAVEKVARAGHRPSWNSVLWSSVHDTDTSK